MNTADFILTDYANTSIIIVLLRLSGHCYNLKTLISHLHCEICLKCRLFTGDPCAPTFLEAITIRRGLLIRLEQDILGVSSLSSDCTSLHSFVLSTDNYV